MTKLDRNWLLLGTTCAALTFLSMAFGAFSSGEQDLGFLFFVVILAVEFVIYFIVLMLTNPRATPGMAGGGAAFLLVLRGICSVVGAILAAVISSSDAGLGAILLPWVSPINVVIQGGILLFTGPYLLALTLPGVLGEAVVKELLGTAPVPRGPATRHSQDTSPTGGFIQVFSYEELAAVIKKSHGVEGFVLTSTEGLVVWKDFPLHVDMDALTSRFMAHTHGLNQLVEAAGLTKVRRVMVESREHFVFATPLNQNFGLILIFNGRIAQEEVLGRVPVIAKTCREFLQWKYSALPLQATAPRDSSFEMA